MEPITKDYTICHECGADLDEIMDRIAEQADRCGMESTTEQEQAFMEGYQIGTCPDCMI